MSYEIAGNNRLLGVLKGVNMNTTVDQPIFIRSGYYIIRNIVVANASISLTTAAGGLYTGASKTGTTVVSAAQVYTALILSSKWVDLTLAAGVTGDFLTATTLYFSLTLAQGVAATADIYIFGDSLV